MDTRRNQPWNRQTTLTRWVDDIKNKVPEDWASEAADDREIWKELRDIQQSELKIAEKKKSRKNKSD